MNSPQGMFQNGIRVMILPFFALLLGSSASQAQFPPNVGGDGLPGVPGGGGVRPGEVAGAQGNIFGGQPGGIVGMQGGNGGVRPGDVAGVQGKFGAFKGVQRPKNTWTMRNGLVVIQGNIGDGQPGGNAGVQGGGGGIPNFPDVRLPPEIKPQPPIQMPQIRPMKNPSDSWWQAALGRTLFYAVISALLAIGTVVTSLSFKKAKSIPQPAPAPATRQYGAPRFVCSPSGAILDTAGVQPEPKIQHAGGIDELYARLKGKKAPPQPEIAHASADCGKEKAVEPLGPLLFTLKPGSTNMVAGIIIGILMIGGALVAEVASPLNRDLPRDTSGFAIWALIHAALLGLAFGGVALIVWVKRQLSLRVMVYADGFVQNYRGVALACRWDQIEEASVVQEQRPFASRDTTCIICCNAGVFFRYTQNDLGDIDKLVNALKAHVKLTSAS